MALEKLKINCRTQKYNLDQSANQKTYKDPQTQTVKTTDITQKS